MPSPTRLNNFLACSYLNTLRRAVDSKLIDPIILKDPRQARGVWRRVRRQNGR